MVNALNNLSKRDQMMLLYGAPLMIILLLYFFVIDLNQQKNKAIQVQIEKRQAQIPEMQMMAETILDVRQNGGQKTAEQIIEPWLDRQELERGKKVIISKTIPPKVAKELMIQLYNKGQTKLIEKDQKISLWHKVN